MSENFFANTVVYTVFKVQGKYLGFYFLLIHKSAYYEV